MRRRSTKPIAPSAVLAIVAICATILTAGWERPSYGQSTPRDRTGSSSTNNRYSPPLPGYNDIGIQTIPEAFNRAFFHRSGDFFHNDTIGSQFTFVFGLDGYSDRQIAKDANTIESLYRDFMHQQVSSDPLIRTPDLENPFNSSLLTTTIYVQPPPPAYNPPPAPVYNPPPAPPVEPPPIPRGLY